MSRKLFSPVARWAHSSIEAEQKAFPCARVFRGEFVLNQEMLRRLLASLSRGEISVDEALEKLKDLPFEDIGLACIDHHRSLRKGLSEVIFGEGK